MSDVERGSSPADPLSHEVQPFLRALFVGLLTPDERIEVRYLPPAGAPPVFSKTMDDAARAAIEHSGYRDTYVGAMTRSGERGRAQDCVRCQVVWADLDFKGGFSRESRWAQLMSFPIPPDMVVDSGGGYQPWWYTEVWTIDDHDRVRAILDGLASYFGADRVSDAARIMRVPGTVNLKYDHRPVAAIVKYKERDQHVCSLSALEAVLRRDTPSEVQDASRNGGSDHGGTGPVLVGEYEPASDFERRVEAGGIGEGERNPTLFRWLQLRRNEGTPERLALPLARGLNGAFAPPLDDDEVRRVVRSVYGWDKFDPSLSGPVTPVDDAQQWEASWVEIESMDFPKPRWVVDRLIPVGLTLVVGRPKLGKSWFTEQIAATLTCGGTVFGEFKVEAGKALYLALEDDWRRLHDRLKAYVAAGIPVNDRLRVLRKVAKFTPEGLAAFNEWLDQHPDARLVVIDMLKHVRPSRRKDADLYDEDSEIMSALQAIAFARDIAIVVLHHAGKAERADPMDSALGTTGVVGACDMVLVLARKRGQQDATLTAMGRDIEETQWMFEWQRDSRLWVCHGEDDEWHSPQAAGGRPDAERSKAKGAITDYLAERGESLRKDVVAHVMDEHGVSEPTVLRAAKQLIDAGIVVAGKASESPKNRVVWSIGGGGVLVTL